MATASFDHTIPGNFRIQISPLGDLNATLDAMRAEIDCLDTRLLEQPTHQTNPMSQELLPLTPRARMLHASASQAARDYGQNYIGSEHLLIALIRQDHGIASHLLKKHGITEASTASMMIETRPSSVDEALLAGLSATFRPSPALLTSLDATQEAEALHAIEDTAPIFHVSGNPHILIPVLLGLVTTLLILGFVLGVMTAGSQHL